MENVNKDQNLYEPRLYETREKSWIKFNNRVLDMASDKKVPLLERVNFLAISDSNLDEFFRVRIAKLTSRALKNAGVNIEGKTYVTELNEAVAKAKEFICRQHNLKAELIGELKEEGIEFIQDMSRISKENKAELKRLFKKKIRPFLTPIIYDSTVIFPELKNGVKYISLILKKPNKDRKYFGMVEVPTDLNKFVEIRDDGKVKIILMEDLIMSNLDQLFADYLDIQDTGIFRALRKYDYSVDPDEGIVPDIMEANLAKTKTTDIFKIDIKGRGKRAIIEALCDNGVYSAGIISGFNDFIELKSLMGMIEMNEEKYKYIHGETAVYDNNKFYFEKFVSNVPDALDVKYKSLMNIIRERDVVLHHPYDSYDTVVKFIRGAVSDPNVKVIKQTLYRVSKDSPIIDALEYAVKSGKQVVVVCEAKARFDEENNLEWANRLENIGATVVYGVEDLKIHAKMCLVIRKNEDDLEMFAHLGTGNYNEKTANIYTDISLLTSNEDICSDMLEIFNNISGDISPKLDKLLCAPNTLHIGILKSIDNCIQSAKENKKAEIIMKCNGLTDKRIIDKIYEARDNGVKITLIVRGNCSLIDTRGILVKSVVGRFLEHSRIYRFEYGKETKTYISSADMMERNLYKRIELMIPILDEVVEKKINNILNTYIKDKSAYIMNEFGEYIKGNGEKGSQSRFMSRVAKKQSKERLSFVTRTKKFKAKKYAKLAKVSRDDMSRDDTHNESTSEKSQVVQDVKVANGSKDSGMRLITTGDTTEFGVSLDEPHAQISTEDEQGEFVLVQNVLNQDFNSG